MQKQAFNDEVSSQNGNIPNSSASENLHQLPYSATSSEPQKADSKAKWKKPFSKIIHLPSIDQIADALKCVECGMIPLPPIFTCLFGHPHCKWCSYKYEAKCQKQVTPGEFCCKTISSIRSKLYEGILLQSQFRCRHGPFGCQYVLSGQEYHAHMLACPYRQFQCPFSNCDVNGSLSRSKLLPHLAQHHGFIEYPHHIQETQVLLNSPIKPNPFDDHAWVEYGMHCYGHKFLVLMEYRENQLLIWVSMIEVDPTRKYNARIVIFSPFGSKYRKVWHGMAQPIGENILELNYNRDCLMIKKSALLRNFVHVNADEMQCWSMKVSISFCQIDTLPFMPIPSWKDNRKEKKTSTCSFNIQKPRYRIVYPLRK